MTDDTKTKDVTEATETKPSARGAKKAEPAAAAEATPASENATEAKTIPFAFVHSLRDNGLRKIYTTSPEAIAYLEERGYDPKATAADCDAAFFDGDVDKASLKAIPKGSMLYVVGKRSEFEGFRYVTSYDGVCRYRKS